MVHILDLPTEVRLEIFRQLLLTKHTKRAAPYQLALPHTLQPAVLCVCRQFQQEAGDVLYRENVFVLIVTNYRFLVDDLGLAGLASLSRGGAALRFARYSLRAVFAFHASDLGPYTNYFMIPAEDLELFCSLFWLLRVRRYHQITLHLTVLPPIGDQQRSIAKQEALLRPFQQLWHIARAAVDGDVDPCVVQRLKKSLTEKIPLPAEARLRFVMSLEAEGDQCLRRSDYFGGAVTYYKAFATCQTFTPFIGHLCVSGSDAKSVSEILVNSKVSLRLMSNITLAFLKLRAWNDVMESAMKCLLELGLHQSTIRVMAHFRKAIALKELGDPMGSHREFQSAIFYSKSMSTQHDIERYLLVEQQKLYGWKVDDEWLDLERAKFGFI